MRTKKQPADITTMKALVHEQAVRIAFLEKELESVKAKHESTQGAFTHKAKEVEEARAIIDQAHDLMDACPNALPRTTVRKRAYYSDETVEQSLIVRMGSWLGATRS